jgi:hypothetical protein
MKADTLKQLLATFPWVGIPKKELPELHHGDRGEYVKLWQSLMQSQGYFKGAVQGNFKDLTHAATIHFQQTHLDSDGKPLTVDGWVGKETWWSAFNPTGSKQRQNLVTEGVDDRLTDKRQQVTALCVELHKQKIHEDPDGSNTGDGVTRFHTWMGMAPLAWCCMAVCWIVFHALKRLPFLKTAKVSALWDWAIKKGMAHAVRTSYQPRPGDLFVMVHNDRLRTGHIGVIYSVSKDGKWLDVFEGNAGNRFSLRRRKVGDDDHVGYINFYGDAHLKPDFEKGLSPVGEAATNQTR